MDITTSKSHSICISLMAALAAGNAWALEKPTDPELAPILIPNQATPDNDFAQQVDKACNAVAAANFKELAAPGRFVSAEALNSTAAFNKPALQHLKDSCQALNGTRPLSELDVANFKAFYDYPDHATLAAMIEKTASGTGDGKPQGSFASSAGSPSAILDTLVQGVAQFIYDRAKAEAVTYLLKNLKTQLCDADEVQPFFSHLCIAFKNMDAGFSLHAMGSFLGNAAKLDISGFPDTAFAYGLTATKSNPAAQDAFFGGRLGLAYYRTVSSGRKPLDVARALHFVQLQPGYDPAPLVRQGIGFASEVVDAVTMQTGWNTLDLSKTQTQTLRCYALGVYYALLKMSESPVKGSIAADLSLWKTAAGAPDYTALGSQLPVLATFLADLISLSRQIEINLQELKIVSATVPGTQGFTPPGVSGTKAAAPGAGPVPTQAVRNYALTVTKALERLIREGSSLAESLKVLSPENAQHALVAGKVFHLGEQLASNVSPTQAVLSAFDVLNEMGKSFSAPQPAAKDPLGEVLAMAKKWTPLISQLAEAQSPDDVETFLVAVASPPNAYETKYKKAMVGLNGLVGISGGDEVAFIHTTASSGVLGAFAPIGVEATAPFANGRAYIGGFLSIVNLGTLVSARFSKDVGPVASDGTQTTVDTSANVNFANLFAPGLFLTLGFAQSPFLVGIGAQVLPARAVTRKLADGSTQSSTTPAIQALISAAIDVPLFNF